MWIVFGLLKYTESQKLMQTHIRATVCLIGQVKKLFGQVGHQQKVRLHSNKLVTPLTSVIEIGH